MKLSKDKIIDNLNKSFDIAERDLKEETQHSKALQERVRELEGVLKEIYTVTQEVMNNAGIRELCEELAEQALTDKGNNNG